MRFHNYLLNEIYFILHFWLPTASSISIVFSIYKKRPNFFKFCLFSFALHLFYSCTQSLISLKDISCIYFFFYIVQLAGLTVDTQMGMTMNQIYDAGAQGNLSVTGEILNVLMSLLFFAANGHHTLLRMMAASGQIVGFGSVAISPDVAGAALELFVECTVLAVKLCMPILAAELLGQVGMGILMKAIPQINVFSINIELKVLIGLILLLLLISPFSEFLLQTEMTMLDSLRELLAMTG